MEKPLKQHIQRSTRNYQKELSSRKKKRENRKKTKNKHYSEKKSDQNIYDATDQNTQGSRIMWAGSSNNS
jgi:hypothetical protein